MKFVSACSSVFILLAKVRVFWINGAGMKSFNTESFWLLLALDPESLLDLSLTIFLTLFLNLSTTCWLLVSEKANSSSLDLKYFDILEWGFLVNSSKCPYSSETPSLMMIILSWGSMNSKNLRAVMMVFPSFCFYLRIYSTIMAVIESTFEYGESNIKISASEMRVLARAIFYNVARVNLFTSSIIMLRPSVYLRSLSRPRSL